MDELALATTTDAGDEQVMDGDQVGNQAHLLRGGAIKLCLQLFLEAPLVGQLLLVEALDEASEVVSGPELLHGEEHRAILDQAVPAQAINGDVDGRPVAVSKACHARTL